MATGSPPPQIGWGNTALFEPGLLDYFEQGQGGSRQTYYDKIFKVLSSEKAKETLRSYTSVGPAVQTAHGAPMATDRILDGYATVGTHLYYTKLLGVDKPTWDDDKYYGVLRKMGKMLARAEYLTREIVGASLINNGFSTNQSWGTPIFSASQPITGTGGTDSNILGTPGDPSFATFSALNTKLLVQKDSAGQPMTFQGMQKTYTYHPDFEDVVRQIMQSRSSAVVFGGPGNSNTANNNSAIAQPWNDVTPLMNPFYTDNDASVLFIPEVVEWMFFNRQNADVTSWFENDPKAYKTSLEMRLVAIAADWRGASATPGA